MVEGFPNAVSVRFGQQKRTDYNIYYQIKYHLQDSLYCYTACIVCLLYSLYCMPVIQSVLYACSFTITEMSVGIVRGIWRQHCVCVQHYKAPARVNRCRWSRVSWLLYFITNLYLLNRCGELLLIVSIFYYIFYRQESGTDRSLVQTGVWYR